MIGNTTESLEAEAILLGVNLSIEKGWDRVVIESDYEVVMNQLRGSTYH